MQEESGQLVSIAFGASAWKEYFGVDVGDVPDLPANIEEILNSKAPFLLEDESSPQRVGDNHLLTLIPDTVNGEAFTLDRLGELVLRNHNGHFAAFQGNENEASGEYSRGYRWYIPSLTDANRQRPLEDTPYWVLLPKTIFKGSRHRSFSVHETMVAQYRGSLYKLPRMLEVAASLLAHYARSGGVRLYASELHDEGWWTFTRCSDVDQYGDPLAVGGFESSGLSVLSSRGRGIAFHGVSGSRKF